MKENKIDILNIIITIIKIICIIVLILLILVLALQRFSNNKIAIGGYRIFNVATGSMVPTYEVGDVIVVKEVDTNSLVKGEVVSYLGEKGTFSGRVVTHRIINIEDGENGKIFTTKGDANNEEDPPITSDQIYGKVIYKCVLISLFTKLMNNMTAFYIIFFIPFAILIFLQLKDSFIDKDRLNNNSEEDTDEYEDSEEDDDSYTDEDEEDNTSR